MKLKALDPFLYPLYEDISHPKSAAKKNNFFKNDYYNYISRPIKLTEPSPKKFANDCLLSALKIFNKLLKPFTGIT